MITLFPKKKLVNAGQQINQILADHAQQPEGGKISAVLRKHFGGVRSVNPSLIPNAPAGEQAGIMKLLQHEIMAQGQGDPNVTLKNLYKYKLGAQDKAGYDKSITNSTQQAYQKIAKAYGNTIKEIAPEIRKPMQDYGDAKNQIKKWGGGEIHQIMQTALMGGGGVTGMALRQLLLYPIENKAIGLLHGQGKQPVSEQTNANIGWK